MVKFSCCKINIGLDIVAKRPDGYHDVVTAMVPVPWCDVLEVVPADGPDPTLTVLGRQVDCPPEKNLVMKAFRAMEQVYQIPPAKIVLQKNIPDGAGLGGGSADAAFTLRLLNEYFDVKASADDLAAIAAGIGADCPFFVYDRPMLATGIGTTLTPIDLDLKGWHLLIAKPSGAAVSTKQAYAGVVPQAPAEPLEELLKLPVEQWMGRIKNDFEPSIFKVAPQVEAAKRRLLDGGAAYASMSGSGAAVYGLFTDADACKALEMPGCDTFRCSF